MKDKLTPQQYIELLPEVCASRLPSTGEVILIVRGSSGYYLAARDCDPDAFNELWGVTPAQVQAMEAGSMFGWDTPGANPDHTILECRILLDMETRSQACMDPGVDGDGVLCYGYKVGDGPVTVKHVADLGKYHYNKRIK